MPNTPKNANKPAPASSAKTAGAKPANAKTGATQDAIQLLTADHDEVKGLFKQYQKLVDASAKADERRALAEQICDLLTVHTKIEEDIFYPAARAAIDDDDLLDEAEVEHSAAKDLIAQLKAMDASDDLYDAKVTVLGEQIDHHVKEEEGELFPKCKKAKMDLTTLGSELDEEKTELMGDLGESAAD